MRSPVDEDAAAPSDTLIIIRAGLVTGVRFMVYVAPDPETLETVAPCTTKSLLDTPVTVG